MEFIYADQHQAEAVLITSIDFRFNQTMVEYVRENVVIGYSKPENKSLHFVII
ncbi:MAG: hypothetical protein UV78_C0044G0005 [Parcubacteria group bacterium GW2011_GWA2_43_17]|nr:MAG: hypothetical protein UV78_C0044G0005 [Parcubacteria group bacterium GW2011_GWA2_43_17]KKT90835.1 MAG: hypothetical protein UW91_C0045G0005 [Parcubacteria group bacterium GW2011_GWF2_45_11]